MNYDKKKVGNKDFIAHPPKGAVWVSVDDVLALWQSNSFSDPESKSEWEIKQRPSGQANKEPGTGTILPFL